MEQDSSPSLAAAIEQEQAANQAAIAALEEREPVREVGGAEREAPRDDRGRFASQPLDENELRNRIDLEQVRNAELLDRALQSGLVIPDDQMEPELWAKAFKGRMAAREGHSTTPPVESESPDSEPEASQASGTEQTILDSYRERAQSFAAEHEDFSELVGAMELPPSVSAAVELAILTESNGPEIAYELARNPDFLEDLGKMTPAQAASRIGRVAEHLDRKNDYSASVATAALYAPDIPPDLVNEFHRKSRELHQQNPLSDEELQTAQTVFIEPAISAMIISMDAPEIAHHLMRNPHIVARLNARLNSQHPLAAATELAEIKAELGREGEAKTAKRERRLPTPISPTRKTAATDTGLSDNLSAEEWHRRFKKKMGYND
jgi:hypothetical protein